MYIFTLVDDLRPTVERLKSERGDFSLVMLYNDGPLQANTSWNLIVSAEWADRIGSAEATRVIAGALSESLEMLQSKEAISRITVLKTSDPFVRDMRKRYPLVGQGAPLNLVTAGEVSEGSGFLLYSQPAA
jgi:hypothetical protein